MKEIEILEKRRSREKHFLQKNGEIIAKIYSEDVHFFKNGKYEEIDNTLIEDEEGYTNKQNSYKVHFNKNTDKGIMKMETSGYYLDIKLKEEKIVRLSKNKKLNKFIEEVRYNDIIDNIDLEYKVLPNKVKEAIIIKNRNNIPEKLEFIIDTNLTLILNLDKSISAVRDGKVYFNIEAPYMIDASGKINKNIYYNLLKDGEKYRLNLILDTNWLANQDVLYPIMIDPTITNYSSENSVFDTYIYPGDTNVDKNSQDILKAGVERINGNDIVNRTLIKFELPVIGTGSQIIDAKLQLVGYGTTDTSYMQDIMEVRRITSSWTENEANWNNMNDKYDASRIDGSFYANRSIINDGVISFPGYCYIDLTDLVKRWYTDLPNYGIMIKSNDETYKTDKIPAFYSKNNTAENYNPKPIIQITYRNQNGLENYMKYIGQNLLEGNVYTNTYNGNLISKFGVGNTIKGKQPAVLEIIYNTNNVILNNNYGCGLGWKFNLYQIVKSVIIDDITYLEYVDSDGTVHYFRNYKNVYDEEGNLVEITSEDTYYDEDGLGLSIINNTNYYILIDKNGNQMKFLKISNIGYLTEIIDISDNKILIEYNSNQLITKVTDANNSCINITYETDVISVISPDRSVILNYSGNKLVSINTVNGTTLLTYNENNIITTITDVNGKKAIYEYYEYIPYKVKKIVECGINNNIGRTIELKYKFSSTTLIDNEGKTITVTFNKYGNIASITNLRNTNSIKGAYGKEYFYGVDYQEKNKLSSKGLFVRYTNNYLTNTSFESDDIVFASDTETQISISNEQALSGSRSLKIVNTQENKVIQKSISISKNEFYTFSLYAKNNNTLKLSLSYIDANNEIIENVSNVINASQDFDRSDVTIYYPEEAISDLIIKIYLLTAGTAYIDDIQLEDGEVVNKYNYIENSDFSAGTNGWILDGDSSKYEIVTLQDNIKALKINMDPKYTTGINKIINISGQAEDIYTISFWYKNEGLHTEAIDAGDVIYNNVTVSFEYDDEYGSGIALSNALNVNNDEWQFFTCKFKAMRDYNSINVKFLQVMNANKLYVSNICLYKDERQENYLYDTNGNISKIIGVDNETSSFKYDINNKLVSITKPSGDNHKFEYDTDSSKLLLSGLSDNGVMNQSKYDENGNTVVTKMKYIGNDINEGFFRIRSKGTNSYLTFDSLKFLDTSSGHSVWKIEKEENYYKFKHPILVERYISSPLHDVVLSSYQWANSLYSLIKQEDNSYLIKCQLTNVYLVNNNGILALDGSPSLQVEDRYKFYIEELSENLFIEDDKKYTTDGRFIESEIDSALHTFSYETDSLTGLIVSTTNAKNQKKFYEYNDKKQLTKITHGDRITSLSYVNNLIEKVSSGNKEYNFIYDEFYNAKSVKIGNNTLSTYEYADNNGNLSSLIFGNDNKILYEYDEFNRMKIKTKMDDVYNYKYNNNGFLSKKISNNENIRYYYDEASRLNKYINNDFKINYLYDLNGNVKEKLFNYKSVNNTIKNTFTVNNAINKTDLGESILDYIYDNLGRLISKKINNSFVTNYEYLTNGNRSSLLIKSINNNGNHYSYKYDKLSNITHIYHNNILEKKYYYDDYNQLVQEDDYLLNTTIRYKYNNSGNIMTKKIYELKTYNLLAKNIYEYSDLSWEDKLTKFNNDSIQYDQIGNPIKIGDDVILTWKNGLELSSYSDNLNTIIYEYNDVGNRIKKKINNTVINYMLEGKKIIYEERNGNIIYYLYNDVDNLIGFKYDDKIYYYIKNIQNDIIGIMDSEFNNIANYEYDGYGNILSVKDENGIIINENNEFHVANINPFRYRSYYYDTETKLYYLNSRYYNPLWGRFISADSILAITDNYLSNNLYVFALNNPISFYDEDGNFWKKIKQAYNKAVEVGKNIYNNIKKEVKKAVNYLFGSETSISTTVSEVQASSFGVTVSNTTTTSKYSEKSDAIIKGNIDLSTSGLSGGIGVGDVVSVGVVNSGLESSLQVGLFDVSLNLGLSFEKGTVFLDIGKTAEIDEITDTTNGTRIDVSVFTIAAVFAVATVPQAMVPVLGLAFS